MDKKGRNYRVIAAPDLQLFKPSKTVFNILNNYTVIENIIVLDLFSVEVVGCAIAVG